MKAYSFEGRDFGMIVTELDKAADRRAEYVTQGLALGQMCAGTAHCQRVYVEQIDDLTARVDEAMRDGVRVGLFMDDDGLNMALAALDTHCTHLWNKAAELADAPECEAAIAKAEACEAMRNELVAQM